jgi:CubicO group peptidase (beta-lactamase class C family)
LGIPAAAEYSAARGETALLVWQDGRTIFARGAEVHAPPVRVFSITKSLVAIGVFRSVQRGAASLASEAVLPAARGAKWMDLMNQDSGLPSAQREFYSTGLRDKAEVLEGLRRVGDQGTFVYGPSHWEVLAEEIGAKSGTPVSSWLRRNVPGVRREVLARWRRDGKGGYFFSTGAWMNAWQLLPAGREVLSGLGDGKWPQEVRAHLARGSAANGMYALGFWLNRRAAANAREVEVEESIGRAHPSTFWRDACLSRVAPRDLVAMIGSRGQRVYVVPSRGLVVIRLGLAPGFSDARFLGRLFGS